MEEKIGRFLKLEEAVHHINHIRTDNRIENLQLFATHGQHTKIAHPEVSRKGALASIGKVPWNKGKEVFSIRGKKNGNYRHGKRCK